MKHRFPWALSSLLILGFLPQAWSAQTLSQFIASSASNAYANRAARANSHEKDAAKDEALFQLFPKFNSSVGYTYNSYSGQAQILDPATQTFKTVTVIPNNQVDFIVGAQVPIFDLQAIFRYKAAKETSNAASYEVRSSMQQVYALVARAYYQFVGSSVMLDAARQRLETMKNLQSTAEQRLAQGQGNQIEVDRAVAEVERARQTIAEVEAVQASAFRSLRSLTGISPDSTNAIQYSDSVPGDFEGEVSRWTARVDQLPGVRSATSGVASADQSVYAARTEIVPKITATATNRLTNAAGFQTNPDLFAAGVMATWNFDFGYGARIREKEAIAEGARIKLDQARDDAKQAIESAYDQVSVQKARSIAARAQAEASQRAAELAARKYLMGEILQQEAYVAQQDAFNQQINRIQAYSELYFARALLRISAGEDLTRE